MASTYKTIDTRKGRFVVEWTPEGVKSWLTKEAIKVQDFSVSSMPMLKSLIRAFYALACKDCLKQCPLKQQFSKLSAFARSLEEFKHTFYAEWSEAMSQAQEKNTCNKTENHSLDQLQAGLFYLTTQYTLRPCPHIAERIVWQLEQLCHHPHIELLPNQKYLYSRSLNLWRGRMPTNGAEQLMGNETRH